MEEINLQEEIEDSIINSIIDNHKKIKENSIIPKVSVENFYIIAKEVQTKEGSVIFKYSSHIDKETKDKNILIESIDKSNSLYEDEDLNEKEIKQYQKEITKK